MSDSVNYDTAAGTASETDRMEAEAGTSTDGRSLGDGDDISGGVDDQQNGGPSQQLHTVHDDGGALKNIIEEKDEQTSAEVADNNEFPHLGRVRDIETPDEKEDDVVLFTTAPTATSAEGISEQTHNEASSQSNRQASSANGTQERQQRNNEENEPRREVNPDFQEFQQTGAWGKLSKWECRAGVAIALLVAIVVAIVVGVVVHKNKNKKSNPKTAPPFTFAPTPSPSLSPGVSPSVQLSTVLGIIGNNTYTNASLQLLPNNVTYYSDKANDITQAYEVRAMSWLLYEDSRKQLEGSENRYTLAALYFALGGPTWINNTDWLSDSSTCQWFGVRCDLVTGFITELDLESNNVNGTIPSEISLLTDLVSLQLADNRLSGTLSGDVVGSLPVLSILNIANNSFVGTVPDNLARNNVLRFFPKSYCDVTAVPPKPTLNQFALDCNKEVSCILGCCPTANCY